MKTYITRNRPLGSRSKIYQCWYSMKYRCANKNPWKCNGISVCKEWKDSYETFYDYVIQLPNFNYANIGIGKGKRTIDRIDNNGNYEIGNIRWATQREQYYNSSPWINRK